MCCKELLVEKQLNIDEFKVFRLSFINIINSGNWGSTERDSSNHYEKYSVSVKKEHLISRRMPRILSDTLVFEHLNDVSSQDIVTGISELK